MLTLSREFERMRRSPTIEYQTLVCNALLVTICFFLLPQTFREWLFSEFHGTQTFVIILASWMISDVISTNLLGHDPDNALRALDEKGGIARLVRVKAICLALWTGAAAFCVSLYLGTTSNEMWRTLTLSLFVLACLWQRSVLVPWWVFLPPTGYERQSGAGRTARESG